MSVLESLTAAALERADAELWLDLDTPATSAGEHAANANIAMPNARSSRKIPDVAQRHETLVLDTGREVNQKPS